MIVGLRCKVHGVLAEWTDKLPELRPEKCEKVIARYTIGPGGRRSRSGTRHCGERLERFERTEDE